MEKILILGCIKSGTTLLASLLGAHSQINMFTEAYGDEINYLVGKKYQAIKLNYPHIDFTKKRGQLYRLLFHKLVKLRIFLRKVGIYLFMRQGCKYSVEDYIKMRVKIIIIHRTKEGNIESMVDRGYNSIRAANNYWETFNKKTKSIHALHLHLSELTKNPEKELKRVCDYLRLEFEPVMLNSSRLNNTYANKTIELKQ